MARGRLIVIEGLDGAGSTTQAELLRGWFVGRGLPVHLTREPTDGPVGSLLRLILARATPSIGYRGEEPYQLSLSEGLILHQLFPAKPGELKPPERLVSGVLANYRLEPYSLALLFAADRMQHVHGEIMPKLEQGVNVICDRYHLSSLAYQTTAPGVDLDWVFSINCKSRKPDLTVFLEVPAVLCGERMKAQRAYVELYETVPKLEQVRLKYLAAIEYLRTKRHLIKVVDGARSIETVHEEVAVIAHAFLRSRSVSIDNP